MAILQGCCCFNTVRKGSYACAIYTMVYDSLNIILLPMFIHEERDYYAGNNTKPKSSSFLELDNISPATMIFNILMLAAACATFIASLLLIYGLQKDNRIFLVPWIVTFIVQVAIDVMHNLFLIATSITKGPINPTAAIIFTVDFILFSVNAYSLLCVISQYQEYQAGRGRAEYSNACRQSRVRYMTHQTAISCLSTRKPGTYNETTNSPTANHSTLQPAEHQILSPLQRQRKGSQRHVQFGEYDEPSVAILSSVRAGKFDETDNRLDVVAEEPSWEAGENSSGAPLCGDEVH